MSGSKDILIEQLRERAEKTERFNAYLLGETVYAQMQNEEETGDKIAEEIVETLMETLIEPWMGLTKEQIERCRVIIPERLPRAILCMRDLNRRLAVEEEEEKKLAAERDEAIAEAEAHNAAATQYEKDIATLRAERDEARAERDRRPDISEEDAAALVADYERVTDPVTAAEVRSLAALRAHAAKAVRP